MKGDCVFCGRESHLSPRNALCEALQIGAAVAFGFMGMAEAIRETYLCWNCGAHVGLPEDRADAIILWRCPECRGGLT